MHEWIVPSEDSGKKVIAYLTERLGDRYSARSLKRVLESNRCQINGRVERFASAVVGKGDHILLQLEDLEASPITLKVESSRILYEDNCLVIYDKPPGVNCDEKGILKILKAYNPQLQLIHRLDRDTTGVLILAKSPVIFEKMVLEFKEHQVNKCYIAIVDGVLEKKEGEVDNYLGKKHVYAGQTIWGSVKKEEGLHAHTDWIKIKEGKNASLVFCYPVTGRTHQIRVHLAGIGHPIVGDFQYCKRFRCAYRPNRYLLHAYRVSFPHPITGKEIDVQAPLPDDFNQAQQNLFGTKKL